MRHFVVTGALALSLALAGAWSSSARVIHPPPNTDILTNCAGVTAGAAGLCATIDAMNPTANWPAGTHVNLFAGTADRATGATTTAIATHGGAFAAAVAQQLGIYLLRPPQAPQQGLENAQFVWLWNQAAVNPLTVPAVTASPRNGWTVLGTSQTAATVQAAQTLANAGYLVLAASAAPFDNATCQPAYFAALAKVAPNAGQTLPYTPDAALCPGWSGQAGNGQIAVVRPNAAYLASGLSAVNGPVIAQAGPVQNSNAATALNGFSQNGANGSATYSGGMIYFFVYGGLPANQATAAAGLYTIAGQSMSVVAAQRSAQGAASAAIFTFDGAGQPIWYYGEGALTPAASGFAPTYGRRFASTTTTATAPLDVPALWKPYFQPATGGSNFWDPDGGPVAATLAGTFGLGFSPYSAASPFISANLNDSGTVTGATGPIVTNAATSLTLTNRTLTEIATAAPPAANAPSAGWWYAAYGASGWNAATAGFKPLGLFLDIQGRAVTAMVAGAAQTPTPTGSTVAPYRPYWLRVDGTVQTNGQIDGNLSSCTLPAGSVQCTATAATAIALVNGALVMTINGDSVTFQRYATQAATVPGPLSGNYYTLPFAAESGVAAGSLKVNVAVSGNAAGPFTVMLDTGSRGLWISPALAPASLPPPGPNDYGYIFYWSSGNYHLGYWAPVTLTFPDALLNGQIAQPAQATVLALVVQAYGCLQGTWPNQTCPTTTTNVFPAGTKAAFMGVGFDRTGHGTGFGLTAGTLPDPSGPGTASNLQIVNPFLNLTEMTAGTMWQGYRLGPDGIVLGLTAANTAQGYAGSLSPYAYAALLPTGTANLTAAQMPAGANPPPDWQPMSGSARVGNIAFVADQAVIDIGITDMLLTPPTGVNLPNLSTAPTITINLLGANGAAAYSFTSPTSMVAPPNRTLVPSSVAPSPAQAVTWTNESLASLVNTGIYALNGFNYLYDAAGGYIGLQLNAQSPGTGATLTLP